MSLLRIPQLCLVVLVGPSGAGKSTFARQHFLPTEVLSSDQCRGWVRDDQNDQSATNDAFDVLHYIAAKRLAAGRLTVVDATNVRAEDRKHLVELARAHDVLPVALVFDLPERVCHERNKTRADRQFGPHVVRQQLSALHRAQRFMAKEGFRSIHTFRSVEMVNEASIEREKLWNDRRDQTGPFDLIGDVHGCRAELVQLLGELGYRVTGTRDEPQVEAPAGRRVIFVGDLVDRGPDSPGVLKLVMHMVAAGTALCVPGNHDVKLLRKLNGREVKLTHGLAETMAQLESESAEFKTAAASFIDGLVSHLLLDGGRLVVAHAGMKQAYQGRSSGRVREFALYGESTGETDAFGLPVRYDWARDYRGSAMVVYGHTPIPEPEWVNHTICIDTGCVFGGRLTALRYPEKTLVSVPALQVWYEPLRPLQPVATAEPGAVQATMRESGVLDFADVSGKRQLDAREYRRMTIRADQAAAALEVMSRFAIDPRWLVYLPPTMAPPETAPDGPLLERTAEAVAWFVKQGQLELIAQEKHMGSRAVIVLCRDLVTARQRFGIDDDGSGVIYTRTGRRFFGEDRVTETALLDGLRAAVDRAGLWQALGSDWLLLDAELLPWSAKAQELLQQQYAPTGSAASQALARAGDWLAQAQARGVPVEQLATRTAERLAGAEGFIAAYGQYCWPVKSIADYRVAPFHLLACEGMVGLRQPHAWHLHWIDQLVAAAPELVQATRRFTLDASDPEQCAALEQWWQTLTAAGGEGIVLKPACGLARGERGLLQPAIKVRGREYLRIIYGPEYTLPEHLERLRQRGVKTKQGLAIREYALGLEALDRFVAREPLYRVHECVFGVLALESEPVDPRL